MGLIIKNTNFGSPLCFRFDLKSENKHVHITGTLSKAQNAVFVLCKVSLI
jgi:hypothetical protein